MKIDFCVNHPNKMASYRCYYCKNHICKNCRHHRDRHYFCSSKCYWKLRLQNTLASFKKSKLKLIVGWNALLTIGLLATLAMRFNASDKSAIPATPRDVLATPAPAVLPTQPLAELIRHAETLHRQNSSKNSYELTLPLKKGSVVNVWRNNWPVISRAVTVAGQQQFSIPLDYDKNLIRVGVWDQDQQLVFEDQMAITYKTAFVESLRRSVFHGSREQRKISLTFDAGSLDKGAAEILQILRDKNIKTTMFITGQFIERYPDLVLQILADGHEIGNHTYNHPHLTTYDSTRRHDTLPTVTREFLQRQLLKTDSLFTALTGEKMKPYWRAPFGEFNPEILGWAGVIGIMHVCWTNGFDTRDWIASPETPGYQSPSEVHEKILSKDDKNNSLSGAIVLMHLGTERQKAPMYDMLPILIDDLQNRGYQAVSITKLLNP